MKSSSQEMAMLIVVTMAPMLGPMVPTSMLMPLPALGLVPVKGIF